MNHTTFNTTSSSCGNYFYSIKTTNISSDLRAIIIIRIIVNALTCPLIIVLNILMMVEVKTKPQLRTKSNIALACLATTDLLVGLVLQPLQIASDIPHLRGDIMFCTITYLLSNTATLICLLASVHHLVLLSAERYVAIKHPFAYEKHVTEFRITMASLLVWTAAIILSSQVLPPTAILVVSETLLIVLPIYFNASVYKEVSCRNKKQIAANQVSLEAKEKLIKKAFHTTVIILLVVLLCYIPTIICAAILISLKERIPSNIKLTSFYLFTLLSVLNSLFNPLIYAVKIRYFRVAFIQLLSRKTISQAEELEKKIFGQRQIGVNSDGNVGQGNQTLNNKHEPTSQTELHGGRNRSVKNQRQSAKKSIKKCKRELVVKKKRHDSLQFKKPLLFNVSILLSLLNPVRWEAAKSKCIQERSKNKLMTRILLYHYENSAGFLTS